MKALKSNWRAHTQKVNKLTPIHTLFFNKMSLYYTDVISLYLLIYKSTVIPIRKLMESLSKEFQSLCGRMNI